MLKSRDIYKCFIDAEKPTAEHRWEREGYRYIDWGKIYMIPYLCTTSTRLQSLHFRVIHRYIPTLKFLHIRQVTNSALCPKCGEIENISHFLFHCPDVNSIWIRILTQLERKFDIKGSFVTCRTVLFGYQGCKPLVNLIILLIKQYILSSKTKEIRSNISPRGVKNAIMNHFKIEQHIAKQSNTADKFITKWESVLDGDRGLALDTFF